jgi:hypothetical protein
LNAAAFICEFREQQFFVVGIDHAGNPGLTFFAFEAVTFEAAAVDLGGTVSTEREACIALWTRDVLSFPRRRWSISIHSVILSVQWDITKAL